jgi:transposase-like protein
MFDITSPIFTDKDAARDHLEAQRWPDGPYCPHCGNSDQARLVKLAGKSTRPGVHKCKECRKQFTVTVGTVFERSKVPLNKWLLATYLLTSSKKGMSAHQLHRMLGVTYKTAWFMFHRIREAMREGSDGYSPAPEGGLGGSGKTVEADETYIGRKAKNKAFKPAVKKQTVMTLVERDGKARSFHIAGTSHQNIKPVLYTQIDRASKLMTDRAQYYKEPGHYFAEHATVDHSIKEYVRGDDHTNTVESYFGILKRGIMGSYHHVSEAHLKRYLCEFDFRYNNRKIDDAERANEALKGISGKRLTYRRINEAAHA